MSDASRKPENGDDPNRTIIGDDSQTVGAINGQTIGEGDIARVLETIATMLTPEQQDLRQTLPQTTLRPKFSPSVWDTIPVSVQQRNIQSAADVASAGTSDAQPRSMDGPDYVTMQMIGQGGMGTVHLAHLKRRMGRAVAVKQVHLEYRQQQLVQDEFLTEAVLTGKLEHPNIVPIYELGRLPNGDLFYSMKNIKGQAWSDTIGNLSLDENLDILVNICDAIALADSEGVIHRDLKPHNIMIGDFGEVLVLDWGLALPIGSDTEARAAFGGTPAYMAPEMVKPPFAVGRHSDVYLLGAILYAMLTRKPPHGGSSGRDCALAAASNTIETYDKDYVRKLDPSGELMNVALKAMETRPEARYPDVPSFQSAIKEYRRHAESISLAKRATDDLLRGKEKQAYVDFSSATLRFEEAISHWDGNHAAVDGLAETRVAHADAAYTNGDYELGLSLLDEHDTEHQSIIQKLRNGIHERDSRQMRIKTLRMAAAAMLAFILVGGASALYLINDQYQTAENARTEAVNNQRLAVELAEKAVQAREQAAQAQKEEAEQRRAAELARELEKTAKEAAVESRIKAEAALQQANRELQEVKRQLAIEKAARNLP